LTLGALRCARGNSIWLKEEDTSPLVSIEVDELGGVGGEASEEITGTRGSTCCGCGNSTFSLSLKSPSLIYNWLLVTGLSYLITRLTT
jgi:hypothetical protein